MRALLGTAGLISLAGLGGRDSPRECVRRPLERNHHLRGGAGGGGGRGQRHQLLDTSVVSTGQQAAANMKRPTGDDQAACGEGSGITSAFANSTAVRVASLCAA